MIGFLRMFLLLFLPYIGISQVINSNHVHSSSCCISEETTEADRKEFAEAFLAWKLKKNSTLRARALPIRYTVPVVFHLIEDAPAITDAQIRTALASLNNAYSRSNDYAGGQDFSNSVGGVDTQIEFCLAQRAPDGGVTSGITRTVSGYSTFDQDLEDGKLKTMLQWDPRHYVNIWVVRSINSEITPTFRGSTGWSRSSAAGYATLPGSVIGRDNFGDGAVVAGLGASLLAHELGHYLGLFHTFSEDGSCGNDDCTIDGDMVCDTPPDKTQETYIACGGGEDNNSCSSDTLTILPNGTRAPDLDDMYNNFMDYGNGGCSDAFTNGQAERMHFHLTQYRNELYRQAPSNNTVCTKPCVANVLIESIKKDVVYPAIGTPVTFTSTATGVTNYEWYVERLGTIESNYSVVLGTGYIPVSASVATTPNLTHTFATEGKYRVYLKAWDNANPTCFASSSAIVTVSCGVDARFYPDKRLIASKQSVNPRSEYLDSILFTNRTVNGQVYDWTVEHEPFDPTDGPALPVFNATTEDLTHVFLEPGTYKVSLEATNGTCRNSSGPFELSVLDPTMDGYIWIQSVQCYKNDSLRVVVRVGNFGYDTAHAGIPISFYSGNPNLATSTYLSTFYTPSKVFGYDYAKDFTAIVPRDKVNSDDLYAVFNDLGGVVPVVFPSGGDQNKISSTITLPSSGLSELRYRNTSVERSIQFQTILPEVAAVRCANATYDFDVRYRNNGGRVPGINWIPNTNLSCTNCFSPTLQLGVNNVEQLILLTSEYGCVDTSRVNIRVPYDTVVVINADTVCQNDPAPVLSAIGNQLRWYTVANGGIASSTPPIPDTRIIGTSSFWVSETTDGCEGHRVEIKSVVKGPPDITITPPTELCVGDFVPKGYLENTINGTGDVLWYTSAIGGAGNEVAPMPDSSISGSFDNWVTLTGSNGCVSEREQVTYEIKETKILLPELDAIRCANTTYEFDASISDATALIANVEWLPNTDLSCSNCLTPTLQLGINDVKQTLIITSEFGCIDTALVKITVPYDTVSVEDADSVCRNDPSPTLPAIGNELRWYVNESGGTGSTVTPIAETATAGTFIYWVSETTNGCEGHRVSVTSVVKELPTISIVTPPELCRYSDVPIEHLTDAVIGTGTLLWYTSVSGSIGELESPSTSSTDVGSFDHWVTLTGENECVSPREQLTYSIKDIPEAPIVDGPFDVCINDNSPNLNNAIVSGVDILWYKSMANATGTNSPPTLSTESVQTVNYWVTQTVNDCEGPMAELLYTIVDIEIKLDSAFEIDDGQSQELNPEIIILPAKTQYSIEWLDELGDVFSQDKFTKITPIVSANYTAEVSSEYGCIISDDVYVKILGQLFPTHIFSPNGDGANDYWYIENLEDLSDVKLSVFNRWGRKVYSSDDYKNDWNGFSEGQLLPVGTYYYVIDLAKYERKELSGSITIRY